MGLKLVVSNGPIREKLRKKAKAVYGEAWLMNLIQDGMVHPDFLKFLAERVKVEYSNYDLEDEEQFYQLVDILSVKTKGAMAKSEIAAFLCGLRKGMILDKPRETKRLVRKILKDRPKISQFDLVDEFCKQKKELDYGMILSASDVFDMYPYAELDTHEEALRIAHECVDAHPDVDYEVFEGLGKKLIEKYKMLSPTGDMYSTYDLMSFAVEYQAELAKKSGKKKPSPLSVCQ